MGVFGVFSEWYIEFEEFEDDCGEVFEESVVVFGVFLDVGEYFFVLDESYVGGKYYEGFGGFVFVL